MATDSPAAGEAMTALGYEQAREELASIVSRLEAGGTSLEDALSLWERGEFLAGLCESWLDRAEQRLGPDPATT